MKWKKVSEHPLPGGDGKTEYLLKTLPTKINGNKVCHYLVTYPENYIEIDSWCEFNPDEIESADSVIRKNQTTEKSSVVDPSWEEKFRWEEIGRQLQTARLIKIISPNLSYHHEYGSIKNAIEQTETLIAELKKGKETLTFNGHEIKSDETSNKD